jgi:polyisoprenoid-binding protein YceI
MQASTSFAAAAAFALALGAPALAQAPGLNKDPAAVQAGAYTVETSHARVLFSVTHFGFSTWYGDFADVKGTAKFDPKNPAANSVEVSFPTASVTTTNAVLDGELKDPNWMDAAKYPTISFKSTKVVVTAPGHADVTGDFTLHGVTKPVTLKVQFNASGMDMRKAYEVGFNATTTIKRSDFGVNKYVPAVSDEVSVHLSVPFVKTAG